MRPRTYCIMSYDFHSSFGLKGAMCSIIHEQHRGRVEGEGKTCFKVGGDERESVASSPV